MGLDGTGVVVSDGYTHNPEEDFICPGRQDNSGVDVIPGIGVMVPVKPRHSFVTGESLVPNGQAGLVTKLGNVGFGVLGYSQPIPEDLGT